MGNLIKMLTIYVVLMASLVIVLRLRNRLVHKKLCRQYPDYDRHLSDIEEKWISQLNLRLITKMDEINRVKKGISILPLFLIIMFLSLIIYLIGLDHFSIPKTKGAINLQGEPLTVVAPIFFSLILCILPYMLAAKLGNRNVKAFFTLGFSYNRVNAKKQAAFQWNSFVEHHVRRRSFSTFHLVNSFDIEGLIERRFTKFWHVYIRLLLSSCIILILLFTLERHNFSRIYKDRIEISPFTSFSTQTYSRADIVSVDRNCYLRKGTERYPGPNVKLIYRLKFKDGKKLDIIRGRAEFIKKKTNWALYWQNRLEPNVISPLKVIAEAPIAPTEASCKCAIMNPAARRAKYAHKIAKLYSLPANSEGCEL